MTRDDVFGVNYENLVGRLEKLVVHQNFNDLPTKRVNELY